MNFLNECKLEGLIHLELKDTESLYSLVDIYMTNQIYLMKKQANEKMKVKYFVMHKEQSFLKSFTKSNRIFIIKEGG